MLDREIGLTGPEPENAAQKPAAGVARVERQRTVDQPDHGADILAEISQHEGGVGEDGRVVLPDLERLPSKIDALAAICLRLLGPAVKDEPAVAERRPGRVPARNADRSRSPARAIPEPRASALSFLDERPQARAGRDRRR